MAVSHLLLPHSSSSSRFTAGASAFFILSQSGERPERYGEPFRFDTMPSSPSLHACRNTVSPSPSICSLNRMPGLALATMDARVALHLRAFLAGNDAEAVMLDFVQPLAARGQLIGFGREARRDEPGREGTL